MTLSTLDLLYSLSWSLSSSLMVGKSPVILVESSEKVSLQIRIFQSNSKLLKLSIFTFYIQVFLQDDLGFFQNHFQCQLNHHLKHYWFSILGEKNAIFLTSPFFYVYFEKMQNTLTLLVALGHHMLGQLPWVIPARASINLAGKPPLRGI